MSKKSEKSTSKGPFDNYGSVLMGEPLMANLDKPMITSVDEAIDEIFRNKATDEERLVIHQRISESRDTHIGRLDDGSTYIAVS